MSEYRKGAALGQPFLLALGQSNMPPNHLLEACLEARRVYYKTNGIIIAFFRFISEINNSSSSFDRKDINK